MLKIAKDAKEAAGVLNSASASLKVKALVNLATLLDEHTSDLLEVNKLDVDLAKKEGLDAPRIDRLTLTPKIIGDMSQACHYIAGLEDPIGAMDSQWQRPNGLLVGRMRIPLGVIAMIYEARPNVTIDAAILCLKAGNAVILRGGREAINSNIALAELFQQALVKANLPQNAVQLVRNLDHAAVTELCHLDQYIDVMIPRGGEELVRRVTQEATMPVLKHFKGVCHAYIDADCDQDEALNIVFNGKVQRPGVCNALECLLVHKDIAEEFMPNVYGKLDTVAFYACPRALPYLGERAKELKPEHLGYEFHDLILSVVVVDDLDAALKHIAKYGSNHTEIICTRNLDHANRFLREVDASMVGVNASTRFNDGGELGLGAEIGISTSKIHAYGPMGVRELTTTKFVVMGHGQVRV